MGLWRFRFRLQAHNSSTAINLRLFERMDDGDLGTEMTSTGTYSDAVCGVATALLNLPARANGTSLLHIRTFTGVFVLHPLPQVTSWFLRLLLQETRQAFRSSCTQINLFKSIP